MAHVVTSKCVGCKFTDCVTVCPVACFYEVENQLLIHPQECIDCLTWLDECPVHAIYAEADVPPEFQSDIELNATEAARVQDSGQGAIETKKMPCPPPQQGKRNWVTEPVVIGPNRSLGATRAHSYTHMNTQFPVERILLGPGPGPL